jgi:cell wall-associated NlpC family hydrolase
MRRRTFLAGAAGLLALGYAEAGHAPHHGTRNSSATPAVADAVRSSVAARVIAYAQAREGDWYCYGGDGTSTNGYGCPAATYDCSGLMQAAYASAGISIPRTAAEQWAAGPKVTGMALPGDLVFFPGADGTWSSPGHVGLVVGPSQMIQAYETGTQIATASFGVPGALGGIGPGTVIGYTRPWA